MINRYASSISNYRPTIRLLVDKISFRFCRLSMVYLFLSRSLRKRYLCLWMQVQLRSLVMWQVCFLQCCFRSWQCWYCIHCKNSFNCLLNSFLCRDSGDTVVFDQKNMFKLFFFCTYFFIFFFRMWLLFVFRRTNLPVNLWI